MKYGALKYVDKSLFSQKTNKTSLAMSFVQGYLTVIPSPNTTSVPTLISKSKAKQWTGYDLGLCCTHMTWAYWWQ